MALVAPMVLVVEEVLVMGRERVVEQVQVREAVALEWEVPAEHPAAGRVLLHNQGLVHVRSTRQLIGKTNTKDNMEEQSGILQGTPQAEVLGEELGAEEAAAGLELPQVHTREHHNPNFGPPRNTHDWWGNSKLPPRKAPAMGNQRMICATLLRVPLC